MKELHCVWLVSLCVAVIIIKSTSAQQVNNSCKTLYILSILPYPDDSNSTGWDRGFELIPASRLAARHINDSPEILSGYELEVIDVPSEACGINIVTEGVVELYRELYYVHPTCVIGIVGLFCSTTTDAIVPIANHTNIGHVQLVASTSPLHRNVTKYPNTFFVISSSRIFNRAMLALMRRFGWEKIDLIHDSLGVYFTTTAEDFIDLTENITEGDSSVFELFPSTPISDLFDRIKEGERRIGYFLVTDTETAEILCEVSKMSFSSRYTFFLDDRNLDMVLNTSVQDCTREEMERALEGMYIMEYRLDPDFGEESVIVSGYTHEEYYQQYLEELREFENEVQPEATLDENNQYASLLYDQVWAVALAANNLLLGNFSFLNQTLDTNNIQNVVDLRSRMAEELKKVEFTGASGFVRFGEQQEVQTSVDISRINSTEGFKLVYIGMYDAYSDSLEFVDTFDNSSLPTDTFLSRYQLIPVWLGSLVIVCDGLLILLTVFNTLAIVLLRNRPEIKSTSIYLSLVILFGCSLLLAAPLVRTSRAMFDHQLSAMLSSALCGLNFWLFLCGTNIILATLFVRLLRIFHVFRSYRSTGRYWSDRYLFLYITLMCLPIFTLIVVQSSADPFRLEEDRTFIASSNPPFIQLHQYCTSAQYNVWLSMSIGYVGVVTLFAIFFAVQTRHIKRKHFKDTKKVNMFIFSIWILYNVFIPTWFILVSVNIDTFAYVCECVVSLGGAALCQTFLFLPKVLPPLCKFRVSSKEGEASSVRVPTYPPIFNTFSMTPHNRSSSSMHRFFHYKLATPSQVPLQN